jgi:hypothetical protein
MQTWELACHTSTLPLSVSAIGVRLSFAGNWMKLRWRIEGAQDLAVPRFAGRGRADGLWQATCFELFMKNGDEAGYNEMNFSPSERWAAYAFSGYREGMRDLPLDRKPVCSMRRGGGIAIFDAEVPLTGLPQLPWRAALTAVIEEAGGTKSYWSLAHPPGRPDFHDPACFAATVAAPEAS